MKLVKAAITGVVIAYLAVIAIVLAKAAVWVFS